MKCFSVMEPMITLVSDRGQHSGNQAPPLPDPSSLPRSRPRTRRHDGHTRKRSPTHEHFVALLRSCSRVVALEEVPSFGCVYTRLLKDWRKLEVRGSKTRHTYDSSPPASGLGDVEVATVTTSSRRSCIDSHIVSMRLLSVITTLQQLNFQQEEQAWID